MKVFAFALLLLAAVTYGEYCFLSCYVHISCVLMNIKTKINQFLFNPDRLMNCQEMMTLSLLFSSWRIWTFMFHSLYLVFALQPVSCVSPCVVGEALQCNNCVREAPDSGNCAETVETCPPEMDACAKITYPAPHGECCGLCQSG